MTSPIRGPRSARRSSVGHWRRVAHVVLFELAVAAGSSRLVAQAPAEPPAAGHQHPESPDASAGVQHQHDMSTMGGGVPATRDGSGTSWLPDTTPMYAVHRQAAGWMLMLMATHFFSTWTRVVRAGPRRPAASTG